MRWIAALFGAAVYLAIFGFVIAPAFGGATDDLLAAAMKSKQVEQIEGMTFHTLSFVVPADENKPRIARYFSVVDTGGGGRILAVSYEKWTLDAKGNWRIEQWEFLIGTKIAARHYILHETKDRLVLGDEDLTPDPKNAKVAEAFASEASDVLERELKFWLSRRDV